jgi:prevent-host-death family protein
MARPVRKTVKEVPLAEMKDDFSRYLKEAAAREILITRHGKPAGILIGFESLRMTGWSTGWRTTRGF